MKFWSGLKKVNGESRGHPISPVKYNLYFHCSENTAFYIFTTVKYSFFKICIIFNTYFPVFHYFVYNKRFSFWIRINGYFGKQRRPRWNAESVLFAKIKKKQQKYIIWLNIWLASRLTTKWTIPYCKIASRLHLRGVTMFVNFLVVIFNVCECLV